jgi:hypothetical protein
LTFGKAIKLFQNGYREKCERKEDCFWVWFLRIHKGIFSIHKG